MNVNHSLDTLQKHRDLTIERLNKFVQKGQFEDVNVHSVLWKHKVSNGVQLEVYQVEGLKRM